MQQPPRARHNHSPIARFTQQLLNLMRARLSRRYYTYIFSNIYVRCVSHPGYMRRTLSHSIMSCSLAKSRPYSISKREARRANFHLFERKVRGEEKKRGSTKTRCWLLFTFTPRLRAESRGDIYNSASTAAMLLHVRRRVLCTQRGV
jgi:hypothetical protein